MSVLPRTILIAAVVLAGLTPGATATGPETCVEMILASYAHGLRIIAHAGESIALGFASGEPGDGIGYTVIVTPTLCGLGTGHAQTSMGDAQKLVHDARDLIPLP